MAPGIRQGGSSGWLKPETLTQSIGIGFLMTIVSRAAGLGRAVVFARILDRAELGTWAITNNTLQLLSFVLVLGIPSGVSRYVERCQREGRLRSFLTQATSISLGIGAAACLMGIIFCRPLAGLIYEDRDQTTLTLLTCLSTLSLIGFNVLQGVLQGLRVYRINAWMIVSESVGFAALGSLVLVAWKPDAVAAAWAFLVVSVVVTAVPAWMLWRHVLAASPGPAERVTASMWRQILLYSIGAWGTGSLITLWKVLDRYMLIHTDTLGTQECLREIGSYHIIETITAPLLALASTLSILVLPHATHLWETQRHREAGQMVQLSTKVTVLGLTLAGAVLVVFKRLILVDIFGDTSMQSGEILELVLATTVVHSGQSLVRACLLCRERSLSVAGMWLAGLALCFLLNLFLIPQLHLRGAAIASLVSGVSITLGILLLTHRTVLRLEPGTWAVCAVPLVLLLPPLPMLASLALLSVAVLRTRWILSDGNKAQLNEWLAEALVRVRARADVSPA